jgi:hypothetical protein
VRGSKKAPPFVAAKSGVINVGLSHLCRGDYNYMKRQTKNNGATRDRTAERTQTNALAGVHFRVREDGRKAVSATTRDVAGKSCDKRDKPPRIRPDGLTVRQAALVLRVSPALLLKFCRGPLVAYRHGPRGGQLRIENSALADFLLKRA